MNRDRCTFNAVVDSVTANKKGVVLKMDVDSSDLSALEFLASMRGRDVSVSMEPAQQELDFED